MPEYFGKYLKAERHQTNATIDNPVIFLAGYTKKESMTALIVFLISMYFLNISVLLTFVTLPFSVVVAKSMRYIRENMQPNFFFHWAWYVGFMSNLPRHVKLPKKYYFTR